MHTNGGAILAQSYSLEGFGDGFALGLPAGVLFGFGLTF